MIVALDCATKTGWAIAKNDGTIVESGVQDFKKKRGESNGIMFLNFRKWLWDLVQTAKTLKEKEPETDLIAYEQAHFRGGAATEVCVGLQTRCQEVAAMYVIESVPVATNSLKLFATGHGKADKAVMIVKAKEVLGRDPIDDNEADAVHIARWAAARFMNVKE